MLFYVERPGKSPALLKPETDLLQTGSEPSCLFSYITYANIQEAAEKDAYPITAFFLMTLKHQFPGKPAGKGCLRKYLEISYEKTDHRNCAVVAYAEFSKYFR